MSDRRLAWRRLFLLAGSGVLSLLIGELLLRSSGRFRPRPRYFVGERQDGASESFVPDSRMGWRMKPSHEVTLQREAGSGIVYRSNAQGFRGPADFSLTRSNRKRIAIVGDSQSFGSGVPYESTYGSILERRLGDAEVYNFALPGFGVDQMWLCLRHEALQYRPDLVIVGLFVLDFERSLTAFRVHEQRTKPLYRLEEGRLVACTDQDRPAAWIRFLERNSHLFGAGQQLWYGLGREHGVGALWTLNRATLDAIDEDCRSAAAPVLFVYIPDRGLRPFPALAEHFAPRPERFLDLTPEPSSATEDLYLDNGHLSRRGHRHAAERILAHLLEHGLP